MRAIALLLVPLLIAGCLGGTTKALPLDDPIVERTRDSIFGEIQKLMEGVPCQASAVGAATSENIKPLNILKWEQGGNAEAEIRGDLLYSARGGGFSIVNISDPLRPVILSNYTETKGNLDIKVSPDNMTALVGAGWGIDLVDVRNPYEPKRSGQWLFTSVPVIGGAPLNNAHMIFTMEIAKQQWVLMAPNSNTGIWIFKLEGPPEARKLTFVTTTLPVQGGPLGPHDMVVQYDTVLKTHVMYSADGYHGWTAWDMRDPAKPMIIGGLVRPETGYLHTIQAGWLESRRIVVTIAEVGANVMQVYDATNIRAPVLLAMWQVGTPSSAQHNFNIVQEKIYLAHYGSGIFVFDLKGMPTTPSTKLIDYKPVAHYAPASTSFWDIVLKDGVLYGSGSGIHVFGYGCVVPGDKAFTSIN